MKKGKTFLVTGGCGFIGSALVRYLVASEQHRVVNVDALTYAGSHLNVAEVEGSEQYHFVEADIADADVLREVFETYTPDGVFHLAAESHVDRSIDGPAAFLDTNIEGTYTLLEAALSYWRQASPTVRDSFRFLHVSTDEVYGSLDEGGCFTEKTAYDPRSPYSATKAASDHLVRAWGHTYDLPVLITNCSNNYGPYQYPEKLIPVVIAKALAGEAIPVYGDGSNVRDWLYVDDHVHALTAVLERGVVGETYNIGGHNEKKNIEVVEAICRLMDDLVDTPAVESHASLITFVTDRPGHDFRYAIDASKIARELDWRPAETFGSGLRKTVRWYLEHLDWCEKVSGNAYEGERLGLRHTEG